MYIFFEYLRNAYELDGYRGSEASDITMMAMIAASWLTMAIGVMIGGVGHPDNH